jgi:intracellular septation protein
MIKKKEGIAKFLCDYLPLIIFFIAYKVPKSFLINYHLEPLIFATICLVFTAIISLIISYILIKKISQIALFSTIILTIFGSLTAIFNDEIFIKIKPTIINLIFAIILIVSYLKKKPILAILFESQIQMSKQSWLTLSLRFGCYFIFLAILNEIIWRNFTTDFWVNFKVFGMMTLSIIFMILQFPFLVSNMQKDKN